MSIHQDAHLDLANIFAADSLPLGAMYDDHTVLPHGTVLPSLSQRQHFDKHLSNYLEKFHRIKFKTETGEPRSVNIAHNFLDDVEPQHIPGSTYRGIDERFDGYPPVRNPNRPAIPFPHPLLAFLHVDSADPHRYRMDVDYNNLHFLYKVLGYRGGISVVWLGDKMWEMQRRREYASWTWEPSRALEDGATYSPVEPGMGPQGELLSELPCPLTHINLLRLNSFRHCESSHQRHLRRPYDSKLPRHRFPRVSARSQAIRIHGPSRDGERTRAA